MAAVALLWLAGCVKYSAECELVVMPHRLLVESSDPGSPAYQVRVYAYYISQKDLDEKSWAPESYADADAGLIRHRITGEVRSQGLVREQDNGEGGDGYVHLVLTSSPVLLVAVDAFDRYYAYRTFEYEIPMERMYIPVRFRLSVPTESKPWYDDTGWRVVSAEYEEKQAEEKPEEAPESAE